ncbi:MAG: hypothetical protein EXR18_07985 [Flavobacteriaceae bacterium]|nr:hypothetical protein [Flavobacteriaceae bacterium]
MFNHGFSDETAIEEIVKDFIGIDISGKPLKKVLVAIAIKFDERYKNLQPTYAQFSSQHLKVKFEYIIGRVIGLYELDETNVVNAKKFFWDTANAFRIVRQSKEPWPDYEIKKYSTETKNKSVTETNLIIEAKSFAEILEETLYEYQDSDFNINSYAYFEKDNLVVDYWKLADNYEDEYFTIVTKENLAQLYRELEIENENKAELLIALMNAFKGENCFEKVKDFLELKNIPFENNVRHDDN